MTDRKIHGAVDRCRSDGIVGWAKYHDNNNVVLFDLTINDIKVARVKCNSYRQDLEEMRSDGCFAFFVNFHDQALSLIPANAKIKLLIGGTSDVFFEGIISGIATSEGFSGKDKRGRQLSLVKSGRLIVLLGDRGERYLDGLLTFAKEVISTLGENAFITYGTLLGAKREGDVIPHDDDIDIALFVDCESPEGIEAEIANTQQMLRDKGYNVNIVLPTQFHVSKDGFWVDIFVCWDIADKFYMTWAINGELETSAIFPLSQIKIRHESLPAPQNVEAFLQVLYGSTWRHPDPDFDWNKKDVWGKLPDHYKFLAESIYKTTEHWESFYTQSRIVPNWPSQFACFVLEEINAASATGCSVVDIGCGNGRDSFFFSNYGHDVIGLDGSKKVVAMNNARNQENTKFHYCNFNDYGSVQENIDRMAELKKTVVYCRFLLHAIDEHAEDMVISFCNEIASKCALLAFEFRIEADEGRQKETSSHFRRFQNQDKFIAKMERYPFKLVYELAGKGLAKFKRDDAVVCRLIFVYEQDSSN